MTFGLQVIDVYYFVYNNGSLSVLTPAKNVTSVKAELS